MKSLESRSCYNLPQQRKWVSPITELLCQLSVWLLRILPKVLMVREHFLGKGRKPRAKFSRVVDHFNALVLKTQGRWSFRNYQAAFYLKCSQWAKPVLISEIQTPVSDSCLALKRCMMKSEYFNKIHAHHTGVGLCTCVLALTPEGTELCLLQDWNK